ncbi:hypothetical protein HRR83_001996 [Exophiala dermatitidis]|uniref:Uncharacterized protein n=1 Tax=Exophiala dermatitidis TaxID=5970 RepID=A0AAN6EWE7_EXODE|nr:hypothetical protein HRR73_005381 [Exophiala dermatitidis]KAJ4523878.1 hypothetical protein HRR74_002073 [Exophiala dermatitidis]KAJ4537182.1 hypothetical protein HRR76_005195 [Exophiala dermatitidis]KAJ4555220.1 hypothetical protein HRR77_001160 [Exophiala dermatitidis]KAJ4566405.1 hypothetical protein HRR79_005410 [Exophiala dermatitidis]
MLIQVVQSIIGRRNPSLETPMIRVERPFNNVAEEPRHGILYLRFAAWGMTSGDLARSSESDDSGKRAILVINAASESRNAANAINRPLASRLLLPVAPSPSCICDSSSTDQRRIQDTSSRFAAALIRLIFATQC